MYIRATPAIISKSNTPNVNWGSASTFLGLLNLFRLQQQPLILIYNREYPIDLLGIEGEAVK